MANDKAGTDVVVHDTHQLTPEKQHAIARFLTTAKADTDRDAMVTQLDMAAAILAADTLDSVLERREALHARQIIGEPMVLLGVRFNSSDIEGSGPGFYAMLDMVDPDGQPQAVTCGAINVMAQAFRLAELNALPAKVVINEASRPTAAGYKPMWLEKAPEDF